MTTLEGLQIQQAIKALPRARQISLAKALAKNVRKREKRETHPKNWTTVLSQSIWKWAITRTLNAGASSLNTHDLLQTLRHVHLRPLSSNPFHGLS